MTNEISSDVWQSTVCSSKGNELTVLPSPQLLSLAVLDLSFFVLDGNDSAGAVLACTLTLLASDGGLG